MQNTHAEACSLKSYQDSDGVWTIGFGYQGREVCSGLTITQAEAFRIADLAKQVGA
jgi:GH24 family phage-related lysozyme (muramidase)